MYSGVSEGLNYLKRVASHSTKESATGRIRAIPKWAQPPIDYFEAQAKEEGKRALLKEQERIFALQKRVQEQKEAIERSSHRRLLKEQRRQRVRNNWVADVRLEPVEVNEQEQREKKLVWWKEVQGTTYGRSVIKSAERRVDSGLDRDIRSGALTIPRAQELRSQLIEKEIYSILKCA